VPGLGTVGALVVDLVDQLVAHLVDVPVLTPECLVQVGVGFDQAGQQQLTPAIDALSSFREGQRGAHGRDTALLDQQVAGWPAHGANVLQKKAGSAHVECFLW